MERTEKRGYPEDKVVGSVDPMTVDEIVQALTDAGLALDRINVTTAADMDGIETPLEQTGLGGFISRFLLSIGDDLQRLELMRKELLAGRALVSVQLNEDEAHDRVVDILHEHGARNVHHFGQWMIESF
ncbi:MAG: hypothetical protein ACR2OE_13565 [Thermomicrobiales bacterium]